MATNLNSTLGAVGAFNSTPSISTPSPSITPSSSSSSSSTPTSSSSISSSGVDSNSDAGRLATLIAKGQGNGAVANRLRQSIESSNSVNSSIDSLIGDLGAVDSGDSTASISPTLANATGSTNVGNFVQTYGVEGASLPPSTTTTTGDTLGLSMRSPIKGDRETVVDGETNRVIGDIISNYDTNRVADDSQLTEGVNQNDAFYTEANKLLLKQKLEKEALANKEAERLSIEAQKEKALQEQKNALDVAKNEALIEETRAKNATAERDLEISNQVALERSNITFAKLGANFSTASITSAQQIYTSGIFKLAELKASNAYRVASLQLDTQKIEIEHTKIVNKLISDANKNVYDIRKTLSDDIYKIESSIITNNRDKIVEKNKLFDKYQKDTNDNEESFLKKMTMANKTLEENVTLQYKALEEKEKFNSKNIAQYIADGTWYKLPIEQRVKMEKTSGLAPGSIDNRVLSNISSLIVKATGDIPLSSGELASISLEAKRLMESGMDANMSVARSLASNPKYASAKNALYNKSVKTGGSGSGASTKSEYGTSTPINFTVKDTNFLSPTYGQLIQKTGWSVPGKGKEGYVVSDGVKYPMEGLTKVTTPPPPGTDTGLITNDGQ